MKIKEEIRSAYGSVKPLPGGEDRMWIAIDRALDGKAKDVQIQLRPHRKSLRPFLTAAAVIALLLMSLALLRTLRPGQERAELLAATGTAFPDSESTPEKIREIRARGTVVNSSKNRWGIAAMSIPLRDRRGRVSAALTLIGARPDFVGKRRTGWDTVLKEAAHDIEE